MKSIWDEITGCSFGFYTEDEIREMSACEITEMKGLSQFGYGERNGWYDPHMGTLNAGEVCMTCHLNHRFCPGHIGHIELCVPIYNPLLFKYIKDILNRKCYNCHRLLFTDYQRELLEIKLKTIENGYLFNIDTIDDDRIEIEQYYKPLPLNQRAQTRKFQKQQQEQQQSDTLSQQTRTSHSDSRSGSNVSSVSNNSNNSNNSNTSRNSQNSQNSQSTSSQGKTTRFSHIVNKFKREEPNDGPQMVENQTNENDDIDLDNIAASVEENNSDVIMESQYDSDEGGNKNGKKRRKSARMKGIKIENVDPSTLHEIDKPIFNGDFVQIEGTLQELSLLRAQLFDVAFRKWKPNDRCKNCKCPRITFKAENHSHIVQKAVIRRVEYFFFCTIILAQQSH